MKIAATYSKDDGSVFQHFGRTEWFKIYTIEDGKATGSEVVSAAETGGHSALAPFLAEKGVDVLICGGLGGGARMALSSVGITAGASAPEFLVQGVLTYLRERFTDVEVRELDGADESVAFPMPKGLWESDLEAVRQKAP